MADRPSEFLRTAHRRSDHYSPDWDGMTPEMSTLLTKACESYKAQERFSTNERQLDAGDMAFGWAVCLSLMQGLIELDYDIREREWIIVPRYGTLARHAVHGFPLPPPKTGDPAVAQPHRPRAINLED